MIVPGEGFCSLQVVPMVCRGLGGGSVDQVIHASLKMCRIFSITKQLWIKTILSVVQLVRLCQCSPAGRSFPGKEGYCGEI